MNAQYQEAHSHAVSLQHKFRDLLDDKTQSRAHELEHEIQKVVDEFEVEKNPLSIDESIKQVQHLFKDVDQDTPAIMDNRHADFLREEFEHLRMSLRRFDNH